MPAGNDPPDFGTELWLAGFLNGLLIHASDGLNNVHMHGASYRVVLYQHFVYQSFVNKLFSKNIMACKPWELSTLSAVYILACNSKSTS